MLLSLYLHQQSLRRQARAWLKASGSPAAAAAVVARCMWRLNRHARYANRYRDGAIEDTDEYTVYRLKNTLMGVFYATYPARASLERQEMRCCICGGTGWYNEWDGCRSCGGSGIYKTTSLYKFTFDIAGRSYTWHQPVDLVNWPVDLCDPDEHPYREPRISSNDWIEAPARKVLIWTVYEFLDNPQLSRTLLGVSPELDRLGLSLPFVLRNDVRAVPYELRRLAGRFERKLRNKFTRLPEGWVRDSDGTPMPF